MLDFCFVFLFVDYSYCRKNCHCYWRKTKISYTRKLHFPSDNFNDFTVFLPDNNVQRIKDVNKLTQGISVPECEKIFFALKFSEKHFPRKQFALIQYVDVLGIMESSHTLEEIFKIIKLNHQLELLSFITKSCPLMPCPHTSYPARDEDSTISLGNLFQCLITVYMNS